MVTQKTLKAMCQFDFSVKNLAETLNRLHFLWGQTSDVVLVKTRTERNEWSKAFQVAVLQKSIGVAFARTCRFSLSWKEKDMYSSLKTEYDHFLAENAHMYRSGMPAVTRAQTFTNWCFLGITVVCTLNWFCASSLRSFRRCHSIIEELGECRCRSKIT